MWFCRRKQALQDGLKQAIEVPLSVMRIAYGCWDHMITVATHGNETALSDIQVGTNYLLHNCTD